MVMVLGGFGGFWVSAESFANRGGRWWRLAVCEEIGEMGDLGVNGMSELRSRFRKARGLRKGVGGLRRRFGPVSGFWVKGLGGWEGSGVAVSTRELVAVCETRGWRRLGEAGQWVAGGGGLGLQL